jgi:hypothetical protein
VLHADCELIVRRTTAPPPGSRIPPRHSQVEHLAGTP